MYDVVVKQVHRFRNVVLIVYDHIFNFPPNLWNLLPVAVTIIMYTLQIFFTFIVYTVNIIQPVLRSAIDSSNLRFLYFVSLSVRPSVTLILVITSSSAIAERPRDARVTSIRKIAKWNF